MSVSASLKVQMWGNSLAVRIPSAIARKARLAAGQTVEVAVHDGTVSIVPIGERELTLAERLAVFDPSLHGGEQMTSRPVGREAM